MLKNIKSRLGIESAHQEKMLKTLKEQFGFDHLKNGQEEVINNIMNGHSAAAIFPTGAGKSLCYQLPSMLLPHLTLVVSPLLALMEDHLCFMKQKNIPAACINSKQTKEEEMQVRAAVISGETKILMISVERFKNERFREFIAKVKISIIAIDEAHCISEWGHCFRPEYLMIPKYIKKLNIPQVLLLTATATPATTKDMQEKFSVSEKHTTRTGFYRDNLNLIISPQTEKNKDQKMIDLISASPCDPVIVYSTLRKSTEQIAERLVDSGIKAKPYHAGLKDDVKDETQQQFMDDETQCIVATIAFGMGIDKPNIKQVIHYDLPKSIENYSQEIGRSGRDNETATCTLIANESGIGQLEKFIYADTPPKSAIMRVISDIYYNKEIWEAPIPTLAEGAGMGQITLKTLIVYLELNDVIEPLYSYYAEYKFKKICKEKDVLSLVDEKDKSTVNNLFTFSKKARIWSTVDFCLLFDSGKTERRVAIEMLEKMEKKGIIETKKSINTEVFSILNTEEDINKLTDRLYDLFYRKQEVALNKILEMMDFFKSKECLNKRLSVYFGDFNSIKECGHCSFCLGHKVTFPRFSLSTS